MYPESASCCLAVDVLLACVLSAKQGVTMFRGQCLVIHSHLYPATNSCCCPLHWPSCHSVTSHLLLPLPGVLDKRSLLSSPIFISETPQFLYTYLTSTYVLGLSLLWAKVYLHLSDFHLGRGEIVGLVQNFVL